MAINGKYKIVDFECNQFLPFSTRVILSYKILIHISVLVNGQTTEKTRGVYLESISSCSLYGETM